MRKPSRLEHARWRELALEVVEILAEDRPALYSDDVWDILGHMPERPRDRRALGPVMRAAQRAKLIAPSGEHRRVRRCHGHWRVVWQSLVYQQRRRAA